MSISKISNPFAAVPASERSGEAGNAASTPMAGPCHAVPDSEVTAWSRRRRFTSEYKCSILAQAGAAQDTGAIGALLRRGGLHKRSAEDWGVACGLGRGWPLAAFAVLVSPGGALRGGLTALLWWVVGDCKAGAREDTCLPSCMPSITMELDPTIRHTS